MSILNGLPRVQYNFYVHFVKIYKLATNTRQRRLKRERVKLAALQSRKKISIEKFIFAHCG